MLYQARRRALEKQRRRAAGEVLSLVSTFELPVRIKLMHAMGDSAPLSTDGYDGLPDAAWFFRTLTGILLRSWGRGNIGDGGSNYRILWDYVTEKATDSEILDVIEAWLETLGLVELPPNEYWTTQQAARERIVFAEESLRETVNAILDEHDVAYQVVGTEIVERDSMVMHADVVEPTLTLLHGRRELRDVEAAFQKALRELKPSGDPADAITDAARALQEMLTSLGCKGNSIGELVKDARKKGLLSAHDSTLTDGIEKIIHWVNAERSELGDAHKATDATREDAWLTVHVVGALIVRLEKRM